MFQLTSLHEQDLTAEMLDHRLVPGGVPPFDRVIELTSSADDPERNIHSGDLLDLRHPGLFERGDVDIALERCGPDLKSELLIKEIDEAVNEMIRSLVAAMD